MKFISIPSAGDIIETFHEEYSSEIITQQLLDETCGLVCEGKTLNFSLFFYPCFGEDALSRENLLYWSQQQIIHGKGNGRRPTDL